jgi:hypothetical protein
MFKIGTKPQYSYMRDKSWITLISQTNVLLARYFSIRGTTDNQVTVTAPSQPTYHQKTHNTCKTGYQRENFYHQTLVVQQMTSLLHTD